MKFKLILLSLVLSINTMAQNRIFLSPEISIQLPKGSSAFDDQKYKESMSAFGTGAAFKMLTKDIYKINDIIMRFAVVNGEPPANYLQDGKKLSDRSRHNTNGYTSAIKNLKGNNYLLLNYSIGANAFYKAKVYNLNNRKAFNIEIEYLTKEGEKEKAYKIMNDILESMEFKS